MELVASALVLFAAVSVLRFAANPSAKHKLLKVPIGLCVAAVILYAVEFRLMYRHAKVWHKL